MPIRNPAQHCRRPRFVDAVLGHRASRFGNHRKSTRTSTTYASRAYRRPPPAVECAGVSRQADDDAARPSPRFIPDGASVCMGTALEAAIPFAAGHELIRQRRRDLTLIGPISDMLFDQLVGAGCVAPHHRRVGRQCQRRPRPQLPPRGGKRRPARRSRSRITRTSRWPSPFRPARSACPTCPRDRCSAPGSPSRTRRSRRAPIRGRARRSCSCPRSCPTSPCCTCSAPTRTGARTSGARSA